MVFGWKVEVKLSWKLAGRDPDPESSTTIPAAGIFVGIPPLPD